MCPVAKRPDKEVYDVPGQWPLSLDDFKLNLPQKYMEERGVFLQCIPVACLIML